MRKDPGINGWVSTSYSGRSCTFSLEVNSNVTGQNTPDGAPFGLYLYDTTPQGIITNAQLTYWILGEGSAKWTTLSGHPSCWSAPVKGAARKKADGLVYTPYTWTYSCTIDPNKVASDGRLRLGGFHVSTSVVQPSKTCELTFWVQRSVMIDPDGAGPDKSQTLTFERRGGARGAYTGSSMRTMSARSAEGSDHIV